MCGGGGQVQDNSHLVAQEQRLAEEAARRAAEEERQREEERFTLNLNNAVSGATTDAENFFASMGLDPAEYAHLISSGVNSTKSKVPFLDTSPGTYFDNLGQQIFNRESEALRSKTTRGLEDFAYTGFARNLLNNQIDDNVIEAILDEQLRDASEYGENLYARGVINDRGLASALEDLTGQRSSARRRMTEVGDAFLETGRGDLRNIASDARTNINRLELGDIFDLEGVRGNINDTSSNFIQSLGDELRGLTPDNLFDISDFAINAGRGQGAQNLAFDPRAIAGILDAEEDDEDQDEDELILDDVL